MAFNDAEVQIRVDLSHGPATSRRRHYHQFSVELTELVEKWSGKARVRLTIGSYRIDNQEPIDGD